MELSDGKLEAKAKPDQVLRTTDSVTLRTVSGDRALEVRYELKPNWGFVSKRVAVVLPKGARAKVMRVDSLEAAFDPAGGLQIDDAGGASALLVRRPNQPSLFVLQQNPFLKWERRPAGLTVGYAPEMEWAGDDGPFESDRVCIGFAPLTGHRLPQLTVPEWSYFADPWAPLSSAPQLDYGELEAIRSCVSAFLEFRTDRSRRVHIPWCENDYQIDLARAGAEEEYRRIIDRAAELGCRELLFTPQNSNVSQRSDSRDAWGWESLLWLGYGPRIREGTFDVAADALHPSVQRLLAHARSKGVRLMAYAYPTLSWMQNPEWTRWAKLPLGGYVGADTGVRSFQDWLVDQLATFAKRHRLGGFSFDHWWIAYDDATSKYAQWYGCRRILSELRKRLPDAVLDGRQQYQWFGPWTWVGGTYPHPVSNDEQPGSFRANADLHTDRVSADKQRFTSYWYTVRNFAPVELNPGFITHQTQRNGPGGFTTDPFRVKDWDVLGWRYSLLSTVATAPDNLVVDMIPARDPEEFAAMGAEDKRFFRQWMDWPDRHRAFAKACRPILGPPMVGKADGTSMIVGDRGFVFLFNPNYRPVPASFTLDGEIGLTAGKSFRIERVDPLQGEILQGPREGLWNLGDRVALELPGKAAWVLSIQPSGRLPEMTLAGIRGSARRDGDALEVTAVQGEVGSRAQAWIRVERPAGVKSLEVNGRPLPFERRNGGIAFEVPFEGRRFSAFHPAVAFRPGLSDSRVRGEFTVPSWIDGQLERRRKAWPVKYSEEDLLAPWLGSDRLLLFVHIADPKDTMQVDATLDGAPLQLRKAYNSIYPEAQERTFLGFYADIGSVSRDTPHRLEVGLPEGLQPGQFQGVYFENVEPEWTDKVAAAGSSDPARMR